MGKKNLLVWFLVTPIVLLGLLNLCLVFVPEVGFDALWYHLTLPKLWLLKKQYFFPGGLLYYSVMPRLTETLFIPLIHFTGTIGPKFLQFLSGIGICYYLWQIAGLVNLKPLLKYAAVSLFYCTWLVSWESSSAYIDLFRAFLETAALYQLLNKKYILGGALLGLALGTKLLSLFSALIYTLVFGWQIIPPLALLSAPWFFIAFWYTGNPLYPLFSSYMQNGFQPVTEAIKNILFSPYLLTFPFDDFISPLTGIIFSISAIGVLIFKGNTRKIALVGILGAFSTLILSPPSARFLLPFLPALIISAMSVFERLPERLELTLIYFVILSSVFILSARLFAAKKYLPYLTGKVTQNELLTSLSSRLPDTFIDSDGFVKDSLSPNSTYLIDKLHNLYYFPYNFDHTSWADTETKYDYLVTQNENPSSVSGQLLHTNNIGIQIFKLND